MDAGQKTSYSGSGTIWYDLSGNRNNVTLTNGPSYNAANGGSIVFDGVNDYAQTSTVVLPTSNTSPLTLEAFCYLTTAVSYYQTVLGTAGSFSQIGFYYSNFAGGRNGGGGNILYTSLASITANNWYQICMTYDGTNGRFFLNGNLVYTNTIGSNNVSNGVTVLSTYNSGNALEPFTGKLSIARIYNRALSAGEILQNYNTTKGRFGL